MKSFIFDSYHIDASKTVLSFVYQVGEGRFEEKIYLPKPISSTVDKGVLNSLLFNLHLALGISYWKMHCYPLIEVKSGVLSSDQAKFWELVYTKGLGEFFFRNNIDFRGLITFPHISNSEINAKEISLKDRVLVGIGGGKDSIVTWERLKEQKTVATGLIIETQKKYNMLNDLLEVGAIPAIRIRREMDEKLIDAKGSSLYHNGHIPISMIYAWIGVLSCLLYDYSGFVVSNEKSADEGNTEMFGIKINHQWSKSEEFELAFSYYIRTYISPSIAYYSPLRSLSELDIVKEFVQYPQYFPVVSSCNRNFSVTNPLTGKKWCGKCAKCAFAFLLFAACLPKKTVIDMFGINMLEDPSMKHTFKDLTGRGDMKPFDCVGTFEESSEAVKMIIEKGEFKVPAEICEAR
jgi:hypothetical protein